MHALQIQNVKRNIVKKASISELNHTLKEQDKLEESSNNDKNVNGTNINDLPQINYVPEPSIVPVIQSAIEPFSDNSNLNISALE